MKPDTRIEAEKLAKNPYFIKYALDETTDGEPIYIANAIEFDGCFGQGETPEEAIANLYEAMVDYIESLLEDGLPIPSPAELVGKTTSSSISTTFTSSNLDVGKKMKKEETSHHYSNLYVSS